MSFETLILRKSVVLGLIFAITAGCVAPKKLDDSDKSQLIQRVSDRWRCIEKNDYACAYQFLSPAYRRVFSYEMYRNRYSSELERMLTGAKVVAYDRKAAVASVRVGVMSRSLKSKSSASRAIAVAPLNFDEAWLWDEGQWWYHESS